MTEADPLALLTLAQLADSGFPSGGFAFSQGLETLLAEGHVRGEAGLSALLEHQLQDRWLVFDRYFITQAHRLADDVAALFDLDREIEAMSPAAGLREGSKRNGMALLTSHDKIGTAPASAYRKAVMAGEALGHLPLVQGLVLQARGLDLTQALVVAAHGFLAGQVTAAVRLGAIGSLAGQRIIADLHAMLAGALSQPLSPDAPWSFTPLAEIAAMRHETQAVRLFTT